VCLSQSRDRLAVKLHLLIWIYLTLIVGCFLRANFARLPIHFVLLHSNLFVARTNSVRSLHVLAMYVFLCRFIVVWPRLWVYICLRIDTYNVALQSIVFLSHSVTMSVVTCTNDVDGNAAGMCQSVG